MSIVDWQLVVSDLERQVSALMKERDELETECAVHAACTKHRFEQLASCQAREQQLREALERNEREIYHLRADRGWTNQSEFRPSEILALPQDDTALQARLKEEREKCAERIEAVEGEWLTKVAASALIRSMT